MYINWLIYIPFHSHGYRIMTLSHYLEIVHSTPLSNDVYRVFHKKAPTPAADTLQLNHWDGSYHNYTSYISPTQY